ncbi:unnamed protein product [Effrenium voratum]|nr:unnamed protein product [Effrenium voratum]
MRLLAPWHMATCLCQAGAQLWLSSAFGDHMVLQRDSEYNIWGFSRLPAGTAVTATVSNVSQGHGTVDHRGSWTVSAGPVPAGGPYSVRISAEGAPAVILKDVYFGDVFFCSGQSNMEFGTAGDMHAEQACRDADHYDLIRLFQISRPGKSEEFDVPGASTFGGAWGISSHQSVCGGSWSGYFSAVCYFFGRELFRLYAVPIGLMSSSFGGTAIQVWESPDAIAACKTPPVMSVPELPKRFSQLWETMVQPVTRMVFRAFVWYQGESNSVQHSSYGCMFKALIEDWRKKFADAEKAPFIYVELAATPRKFAAGLYAALRLAQAKALELPAVGRATALDLGDAQSPYTPLHPRWKQEVGIRAAWQFQKLVQQRESADGPRLLSAEQLEPNFASWVRIQDKACEHATHFGICEATLQFSSPVKVGQPKGCSVCCGAQLFSWADDQMRWRPATMVAMTATSIGLVLDGAAGDAAYIQYAMEDFPQCLLFADQPKDALPVSQFVQKLDSKQFYVEFI